MSEPETMRVVGRYLAYKEFATGGMASIHLGCLPGPFDFTRTVAIKELHKHLLNEPEALAMFVDEARLASRIVHPNVVPVLDVARDEEKIFLVMDYIDGESFAAAIAASNAEKNNVPIAIVTAVVMDMLRGLHAAHELRDTSGELIGLIHRDVSPQNVLVGADGIARLVDFGIAKARDRIFSTVGTDLKGKVPYMAPEQVSDGEIDRRCDLWAAGVVLWEALTGRRLFPGDNPAMIIAKIMSGVIPKPSDVRADLAQFDVLFMRFLARSPDARPQSAREFMDEIGSICSPAPASAVGKWLEETVPVRLARRRTMVREMDIAQRAWVAANGITENLGSRPSSKIRAAETMATSAGIRPVSAPQEAAPEAEAKKPSGSRMTILAAALLLLGLATLASAFILQKNRQSNRFEERTTQISGSTNAPAPTQSDAPAILSVKQPEPKTEPDASTLVKPLPISQHLPPQVGHKVQPTISAIASTATTAAPATTTSAAPPKTLDCSPPYTVGPPPDFIRKLKRECMVAP
jgi:eukaryotic-like serine/threonine-protein kinase